MTNLLIVSNVLLWVAFLGVTVVIGRAPAG